MASEEPIALGGPDLGLHDDFGAIPDHHADRDSISQDGSDNDDAQDEKDNSDYAEPPAEDSEPECPAVAAWRVQFARGLEEKVEHERRVKAERAQHARETLNAMHSKWRSKCAANEEANQAAEKEILRDRDGVIARMSKPGEPPAWNVVPELIDMSGKYKEGARDTSRMRQVLLKLKTY